MAEKAKKYAHKGKAHMNWRAKRKKRMNAKPVIRGRGGRGGRNQRDRPPGQRSPNTRSAPPQRR